VEVIYLGLNSKFKPREFQDRNMVHEVVSRFNLPERFLLYVGRLNERKNIFNLLQAVKRLKDRKIGLVLAGVPQGRMFDLQKKIRELDLSDRVIVTGHIPDECLPALYSLATVFCFVSFDEGFGLPPLEAMASGIPVVLSETAVLREVCGDAGNYADPNRPEEIAGKIDALLENRILRIEKMRLGKERARQFQWSSSVDKLMGILGRLHIGI
jgi:glycosyltransferase involved in cell wall biosynthesis